jgi:type I restriction enzyme S subunit
MRKGWIKTTLGNSSDIQMGQSPDGSTYNSGGNGLPFMQGSAEFGEHFPKPGKWCSEPKKVAERGDLLLSVRAPVGDTNFADQRIAVGRGLSVIRGKAGHSIVEFLRLSIQLNVAEMISSSGTGMFSSITGQNLRDFSFLLPPLQEQKRIVDLISSVDSYINALQQQAGTARKSRNAVLHELLSAGGDGWTETTLPAIVEVLDRLRQPISAIERGKRLGEVPYYGANGQAGWIDKSIFNETLVLLGEDAIDFLNPDGSKAYMITGPSWVNNHAHVLRADTTKVLSFFLTEALNRVDYSQYVAFGTRSKLTQGAMNGIKILLPPLPEQKRIVDLISSMDEAITTTEVTIAETKKLRSGLLSDLLSGDHEIPASYDKIMGVA